MATKRYKMAEPGHSFSEGSINLSWGHGREQSDVVAVPADQQSGRFQQRVLAGVIVETDEPATIAEEGDIRTYKLMTGDEARAHKAIPAPPVTRQVFNPATGELMTVEIGSTKPVDVQLQAAEAHEAEQRRIIEASHAETADEEPEPEPESEPAAELEEPQGAVSEPSAATTGGPGEAPARTVRSTAASSKNPSTSARAKAKGR